MVVPHVSVAQPVNMNEMEEKTAGHAKEISSIPVSGSNQEKNVDSVPVRNADGNMNEHARATSQTLVYGGVGYHMVNWLVT